MRRAVLIILAGLVVVALGAAGNWYTTMARGFQPEPAPQALLAAEDALASPGLSILGHFDVSYAVRAERAFFGPPDAGALPAPFTNDNDLLGVLQSSGIDVREAIDHVLFGFGFFDEDPVSAAILLGRFPVDRLTAAMAENFEVEHGIAGVHPFLRATTRDLETCGTESFVAHIAKDRLVLAYEPETLSTILDRLETGQPAGRDLTDWRTNRTGNVASIALIVPPSEALDGAALGPIERAMAEAVNEEIMPLRGAFGGISLHTLPPSVGLEGWVEADGPAWPLEILAEAQSWRRDMVQNVGTDLPTLLRIHDRLKIEADGARLRFAMNLDESFPDEIGQAFSEAIGLAFSSAGFEQGAGSPQAGDREEETIPLDQVPLVSVDRSHDGLAPFGEDFHNGADWQAVTGPFGVRIGSLQINADDPEVIDIELETLSSEIPTILLYDAHWERADAPAELLVTGALGSDGRNLLRTEPCGPDRNQKPAELSPRSHQQYVDDTWNQIPILWGSKTVRLEPGVSLSDVDSLTGYVRLTLPTGIESHRIAAPMAGEVFQAENLRLRFQEGNAHAIAFDISGDDSRLMEVRALNQAGDYLVAGGSSGSEFQLGSISRSVELTFKGEPAEIELLIARQESVRDYAFTIDIAQPPFPTGQLRDPDTAPHWSEALTRTAFDRLVEIPVIGDTCESGLPRTQVGPLRICLESIQNWGGDYHGRINVLAPQDELFENQLSALEIVIDSIIGQGIDGAAPRVFATDPKQSRSYISDFWNSVDGDLQTSNDLLITLAESGGGRMIGIKGHLSLRMPETVSDPLSLDITALGNTTSHATGVQATLAGYRFGSDPLAIVVFEGPRTDLLEIVQRGADGTVLGARLPRFDPGDTPGSWIVNVDLIDRAASLEFILGQDYHRRDYPFELTLSD